MKNKKSKKNTVTTFVIKTVAKELKFPIQELSKPLELRIYEKEGTLTCFIRTDVMIKNHMQPIPIYLTEFNHIMHRLFRKIAVLRNEEV